LGGRKGIRPVKNEWWVAGMVFCLERGADLHTAQLMPLPLTVSCFSKIQIGFTFLVPAHLSSPGKIGPLNACVCCVECLGVFGLITKKPDDKEEKLFVFALDDVSARKSDFLTSLSKTVCSSQCRADYVSYVYVCILLLFRTMTYPLVLVLITLLSLSSFNQFIFLELKKCRSKCSE